MSHSKQSRDQECALEAKRHFTRQEWLALPASVKRRLLSRMTGTKDRFQGRGRYSAIKTKRHGIVFDSRWEADCYDVLLCRQRAGEISDLETQYPLIATVAGKEVTTLTVDFTWIDPVTKQRCYGEAKSDATRKARDYPLRKRLIEAALGIRIEEYIQPGRARGRSHLQRRHR